MDKTLKIHVAYEDRIRQASCCNTYPITSRVEINDQTIMVDNKIISISATEILVCVVEK